MIDVEQSLRNGLMAENETVLAFSHLSHIYTQGSSIYTTYVFRVGDNYAQTLARWQKLKADALVLLVIACPCALVISTPITVVSVWRLRRNTVF